MLKNNNPKICIKTRKSTETIKKVKILDRNQYLINDSTKNVEIVKPLKLSGTHNKDW